MFLKFHKATIVPLRKKGVLLRTYIDYRMLRARSPQQIRVHTRLLISHLVPLGFTVNWEKSVLVRTQNMEPGSGFSRTQSLAVSREGGSLSVLSGTFP